MAQKISQIENRRNFWCAFGIVVVLAVATRFHKISEPDHVCWDETHFGKMGSWYINRTFFFDVHPPVGKILIGLSGYLTGYNGKFAFDKPGDKYENTSYIGMRVFCASLGVAVVPMGFLAVHEMTNSLTSAIFSSLLVIFDVGLITLSQYILLDPILLFFMVGSLLGAVKVASKNIQEFSFQWWCWLIFTGTMLSCCISVKFVGLFVVVLIGLMTLVDLWNILGDLTRPVSKMSYCISLWGNSTSAERIFLVQKLAIRAVYGLGYRESCHGVFKENNIPTCFGLFIYRILIFFMKNNHYFDECRNNNETRKKSSTSISSIHCIPEA